MTQPKPISKTQALKDFFSIPDKPVTTRELLDFRREDMEGFDELASLVIESYGKQHNKSS